MLKIELNRRWIKEYHQRFKKPLNLLFDLFNATDYTLPSSSFATKTYKTFQITGIMHSKLQIINSWAYMYRAVELSYELGMLLLVDVIKWMLYTSVYLCTNNLKFVLYIGLRGTYSHTLITIFRTYVSSTFDAMHNKTKRN